MMDRMTAQQLREHEQEFDRLVELLCDEDVPVHEKQAAAVAMVYRAAQFMDVEQVEDVLAVYGSILRVESTTKERELSQLLLEMSRDGWSVSFSSAELTPALRVSVKRKDGYMDCAFISSKALAQTRTQQYLLLKTLNDLQGRHVNS